MTPESQLPEAQINATPLIDLMLVLLVMLILTVPIATHSVNLELPRGTPGRPPPAVQLEIMYLGEMYWNGERVASLEELLPRLAAIAGQQNQPVLKVLPEKRAPYERVAQVLAAAQRLHIRNLSVLPVADD